VDPSNDGNGKTRNHGPFLGDLQKGRQPAYSLFEMFGSPGKTNR